LEEIDEGIFERFIEWAYKGKYTVANFELKASSPPSPVSSSKEECETTEWMLESLANPLAKSEQPRIGEISNRARKARKRRRDRS